MACIFAHVISITVEMTLQRFYCRKKIAQPNTREQNLLNKLTHAEIDS